MVVRRGNKRGEKNIGERRRKEEEHKQGRCWMIKRRVDRLGEETSKENKGQEKRIGNKKI